MDQQTIETLLVLANCGMLVVNILIVRAWAEKRRVREEKMVRKLKKYRSTKLGRLYRKAKDEERKMKRRVTDRIRRAKKRNEKVEEPLALVA